MTTPLLDRDLVRSLMREAEAALGKVAQSSGLLVKKVGATYGAGEVNLRVRFVLGGSAGEADRETRFAAVCRFYGLKPEQYGSTVEVGGEAYRIVGINRRSRTYPIEAERQRDGKAMRLPAWAVQPAAPVIP